MSTSPMTSRPACRSACHRPAAERLWPRRALHRLRGTAGQDRGQSGASGQPRRHRRLRRGGADATLRPRPVAQPAPRPAGRRPGKAASPRCCRGSRPCGRARANGLRLLTGPVTSPTLLRQIGAVRQRFPHMVWHAHAPVAEENARRGAALAFGQPLELQPRLDRAAVVLCLDADPLGPGPDQIRNGTRPSPRSARRARRRPRFGRLYVMEPAMSLTGANADHHRLVRPDEFHDTLAWLAAEFGAPLPRPALPKARARFLRAVAADLQAQHGAAPGAGRRGPVRPSCTRWRIG